MDSARTILFFVAKISSIDPQLKCKGENPVLFFPAQLLNSSRNPTFGGKTVKPSLGGNRGLTRLFTTFKSGIP